MRCVTPSAESAAASLGSAQATSVAVLSVRGWGRRRRDRLKVCAPTAIGRSPINPHLLDVTWPVHRRAIAWTPPRGIALDARREKSVITDLQTARRRCRTCRSAPISCEVLNYWCGVVLPISAPAGRRGSPEPSARANSVDGAATIVQSVKPRRPDGRARDVLPSSSASITPTFT
jgi:hypothetical protein